MVGLRTVGYSRTRSWTLPGRTDGRQVMACRASRMAPSVVAWVMITSGTISARFFGRFVLDHGSDRNLMTAEDAGDFGHYAGAILHVEADVEPAGYAGRIAEGHPRLAIIGPKLQRSEGNRRATQERIDQVGDAGRGGGHLARAEPCRKTRPTASPTIRMALNAPCTWANVELLPHQRRRDMQFQSFRDQLGHGQELDAIAQLAA